MKRFANILLLIVLAGCAGTPPVPLAPRDWTYIGNDPAGTQNILMAAATPVPKHGVLSTVFRFEYTAPHTLTGADGKTLSYVEQREDVHADCAGQTLQVVGERFYDVEGKLLRQQAPQADERGEQRVIPGGINDIMYQAVCGRAVGWEYIGSSGNGDQKIYVMGRAVQHEVAGNTQAWFKTEYDGTQSLIAAPSLRHVNYLTKVSTLNLDCATYHITVSNEVYYDVANHKVFDVQPQGEHAAFTATAGSVQGLMYRAACGRNTRLNYLGLGPHHSEKVYLLGKPALDSDGIAQAHYRIYYLKPGTLTTGPVLHTISYNQRTVHLEADCSALTVQLLAEAYLDASGKAVFTITPPANGAPDVAVAHGSLSEMLWQAACRDAG
ncbi:MAG TPA: hypothetical protein VFM15_01660 [Gammaproteobacteria bacterium]|nr:hypothetical protein [Gammaproteobacteria bacterium]